MLGTSAGGMGRHVAMLAHGCADGGMAVTVYGPGPVGERFFPPRGRDTAMDRRGETIGFVRFEIGDRPRPARDAVAAWRLRRLLGRSRPDVIHAHGLRAGGLAALGLTGARHRPPLVVTVHNAGPQGGAAGGAYAVLERIVAHRAALVTCVSTDLAARMHGLGARDGGLAVVPAAPTSQPGAARVASARRELGAGGRPLVLTVGRLARQKGLTVLLDAAAGWRDLVPQPLLVVVGEGPLESELRRRAATAGLDVRFLAPRDDIPVLLAAADVVAVPSAWEGQPLIVQEALRAGRPLVAFRVGGIPDLTGEDGALLVPAGDTGAFASAVRSVLGDPGLAARLSVAAPERAATLPDQGDAVAAALCSYRRALADG